MGDVFRKATEKVGLEIIPDNAPERRIFYRSDHYNFARKGIPVLYPAYNITPETGPEIMNFYHKPSDEKDLKWLNYPYMQKHIQAVFLTALQVANADKMPAWTPGDEFENVRNNLNN